MMVFEWPALSRGADLNKARVGRNARILGEAWPDSNARILVAQQLMSVLVVS